MTKRAFSLGAAAFLITTALIDARTAQAQPDRDPNQVVARVGNNAITVGEFERRLAKLPRFQLSTYGQTPAEIRRGFLEKVLIPEYLYAQGALAKGMDNEIDTRTRMRDVLKSATLREVKEKGEAQTPVSDADVAAYYAAHRAQFDSPPRYAIWRILLASKDEAASVLAEARKDPTPKTWNELARARSLDKATNQRGGNLGFVTESGDSSDGKIRVDPSVVNAVKAAKDGELIDHPVAEGAGWAVVWRRSSVPEVHRPLKQEEQNIRRILAHERSVGSQDKLIASLRERDVKNVNTSVLDLLEVTSTGQLGPRGKPGRIYRKPGANAPENTPRGLR
ncbi:MAG: peptidyl-prolyl cis-trans isomerase [Deltaproteobacteria bacterium]|nr:peptidyl-prolyl cis-trans isomerase [Deltaproteobacteria bacterium]